ncbi:MAG: hypothetical protein ACREDS_14000 [Limisphaerales bacterium]
MALIIGIIVGAGGMWVHFARLFGRQIIGYSYYKVVDDVTTLAMLKNKSIPDFTHNEENDLSDTLFGLAEVEDLSSITTNQLRDLRMAANYCAKYPIQTGDTNRDQEVNAFLQKVREMK